MEGKPKGRLGVAVRHQPVRHFGCEVNGTRKSPNGHKIFRGFSSSISGVVRLDRVAKWQPPHLLMLNGTFASVC